MDFNRIALYIIGNGGGARIRPQTLINDISGCIRTLGSESTEQLASFMKYESGNFIGSIDDEIKEIKKLHHLHPDGFDANAVNCVFLINSNLSCTEWVQCIDRTIEQLNETTLVRKRYVAIVQRDDMDDFGVLADRLVQENMPVYVFTQETQDGVIFAGDSDEYQLISCYAMLAGFGLLERPAGVYAGKFNKLSLMDEDFERIRRHYVVSGLVAPDKDSVPNASSCYSVFLGDWIGVSYTNIENVSIVCEAVRKKLTGIFPPRECLAMLASEECNTAQNNADAFIRQNFAAEDDAAGELISTGLRDLLRRFEKDSVAESRITPEGLIAQWRNELQVKLDERAELYHATVSGYIRDTLCPSITRMVRSIKDEASKAIARGNVTFDFSKKDFIESTVSYAEKRMKPYKELAAAAMLERIGVLLYEQAAYIDRCLSIRDEIIESHDWCMGNQELTTDKRYADAMMKKIEQDCRIHIKPHVTLASAGRYYSVERDRDELERSWEEKVAECSADVLSREPVENAIEMLNIKTDAEFNQIISNQIGNADYQLHMPEGMHLDDGNPDTIYIYSDELKPVQAGGRELPYMNVSCLLFKIAKFTNILQFQIRSLTAYFPEELEKLDASAPERRAYLLKLLPNTYRSKNSRKVEAKRVVSDRYGDETQDVRVGDFEVKVNGNELVVMLPLNLCGTQLTYTIEAYQKAGTRLAAMPKSVLFAGMSALRIPIANMYGNCFITIEGSWRVERTSNGVTRNVEERFKTRRMSFAGKKAESELYKKSAAKKFLGIGAVTAKVYDNANNEVELRCMTFKLKDKHAVEVKARIANPDNRAAFPAVFPVGEGREWTVYAPANVAEELTLEANDDAGIRELNEDR